MNASSKICFPIEIVMKPFNEVDYTNYLKWIIKPSLDSYPSLGCSSNAAATRKIVLASDN